MVVIERNQIRIALRIFKIKVTEVRKYKEKPKWREEQRPIFLWLVAGTLSQDSQVDVTKTKLMNQ